MKSMRSLTAALLAFACTASAALACDHSKAATSATTASTASATRASAKAAGACTAEMAAQCTPAMRAACEKNAAVAASMGCSMKGAAKTAGMDHCAAAKGTTAVAAATAGMSCPAHTGAMAHDCSVCEDWMSCEQDVRAMGAKSQVVPLKNGAMIVYTADTDASVKMLQSVVAKRNERMLAALAAGSDRKLCAECKQLRGAMASGKLHREVVNVERGCMTLITSNDRGVVQKIRAMTGQPIAMR